MTALDPLAVANARLLQAVDARAEGLTLSDLARAIERDPSNTRRAIATLIEAGHLKPEPLVNGLTDLGLAQLAMIHRAESADEPGSSGDWLTHAQISPDPDNARRDWDSPEAVADLEALAADLNDQGLLQNLLVRPCEGRLGHFTLIGGERRWRAIGLLIQRGDWTPDARIRVSVRVGTELATRIAALSENLQRRDLNPIEKANAFEGLAQLGLTNAEIAERIGKTPEHIQQHRRLLRLDQANQDRMLLPRDHPSHLSMRDARDLLAKKRDAEDEATPETPGQGAETNAAEDDSLTPAARLLLAEIVHRIRAEASYTYADIPVGAEALTDTALADLSDAWLIDAPRIAQHGTHAGHVVVKITHNAALPFDWASSADEATRHAGLRAEQAHAAAFVGKTLDLKGQTYATPWLNTPFTLTEEGEAARARAEALAEQARQTREANAKANEDAAARHRAAHLRQLTLLSPTQVPAPEALAATTRSVTADLGYTLPLRTVNHMILDAEGRTVASIGQWPDHPHSCAMATMVTLSINTAANLPTAPVPTPTEPEEA